MKLPEIPGKIIAQAAMEAQAAKKKWPSEPIETGNDVMAAAIAVPSTANPIWGIFQFATVFATSGTEAATRPKKKA